MEKTTSPLNNVKKNTHKFYEFILAFKLHYFIEEFYRPVDQFYRQIDQFYRVLTYLFIN